MVCCGNVDVDRLVGAIQGKGHLWQLPRKDLGMGLWGQWVAGRCIGCSVGRGISFGRHSTSYFGLLFCPLTYQLVASCP